MSFLSTSIEESVNAKWVFSFHSTSAKLFLKHEAKPSAENSELCTIAVKRILPILR